MKNVTTPCGFIAAKELTDSYTEMKLALAADICNSIIADYKKTRTPYRNAFVKNNGREMFVGFTAESILEAIDAELATSDDATVAERIPQFLARKVKVAVWRLANLAESRAIFGMFQHDVNAALKHIRTYMVGEYHRNAADVYERYGYELTIDDYADEVWLHLFAQGTWKALESYRGDSSVYSWLKTVCSHCISNYMKTLGVVPRVTVVSIDDTTAATDLSDFGSFCGNFDTASTNFYLDRIDEMPWEQWEKDFMADSLIYEASPVMLTEKYGAYVALLQGSPTPYDRAWTDNRNSRMKRDFRRYLKAYLDDDRKVLCEFAKRKLKSA